MSPPPDIVIVGGGAAAHSFVDAYSALGGERPVTILSADERVPYFRPYLTKEFLRGEKTEDDVDLDPPEWYGTRTADVRLHTSVEAIDLGTSTLSTSAGPVAYGTLVLATGSAASRLPVPGGDDPALISVRSIADGRRLRAVAEAGQPVVVVGSGFVGCEVASGLAANGVAVTMLSTEAAPQHDRLGADVGALFGRWLTDEGVVLCPNEKASAFDVHADGIVVTTGSGLSFEAATVIVATGSRPNVDLARDAGLRVGEGVEVSPTMATGAPNVYAIGDIAWALNAAAGRRLRVEHWGDAETMGAVAAEHVATGHGEWTSVPGFWSVITGNEVKYVAWGDGHDATQVRRSADGGVTVWYGKGGLLVGALTVDHDEDYNAAAGLIRGCTPFPL
jgi:NADPH-dependent 2,4-dienoyl-CoA reductase/sulfur reductase-like enzyme